VSLPQTLRPAAGRTRRLALSAGLAATVLLVAGCSTGDSFMDPSVVGRWERTPTRVPVLTHLAPIEDPEDQYVEVTSITAADLLPETEVYRVGAGDTLNLTIWDLIVRGQPELLPRIVDPNGYVEIPQLGRIYVAGLTEAEVADAIAARMQDIVANPLISVVVESRREQSFHLMGAVREPGPYLIPASDYKLLQAVSAAGGVPEYVPEIYIIRQVPLTREAAGMSPENLGDTPAPGEMRQADDRSGDDLLDVIDDLSSPAVVSADGDLPLIPALTRGTVFAQPEPVIDLLPPAESDQAGPGTVQPSVVPQQQQSGSRWVFTDGQWMRVQIAPKRERSAQGESPDPLADAAALVTQRVIRVPTRPLLAGDARYNIIVRPGDVIRVPPPPVGNIYIDGQVNRPGTYNLPDTGRITLTRAITSAGGLSAIAIPERVDLTRMVGLNQQATIMLDLRAIAEGTQPDIFLKPDDRINIGTNFWATPLAIVRNGFRASYGFGFLLDRNFGNDVFGAPPTNRFGE
jgi:polysaccharide export outer membrane protein